MNTQTELHQAVSELRDGTFIKHARTADAGREQML
jgi:hypothetical protein